MSTNVKSKSGGLRQIADVILLILLFLVVYSAIVIGSNFIGSKLAHVLPERFTYFYLLMHVPLCWLFMALAFVPTVKLWQFIRKACSNWSFVASSLMVLMVVAGIIYGGNLPKYSAESSTIVEQIDRSDSNPTTPDLEYIKHIE